MCEAGGRLCPEDKRCDETHGLCVFEQQLTACQGVLDGEACTILIADDGFCVDEVCLEQQCGDGIVTGTEQCDRDDFGGRTCESLGAHQPGPLACTNSCAFDTTACGPMCGNNMLDGPPGAEECDGIELPTATDDCLELGYYEAGPLTCTAQCSFNDNACRGFCGDDIANGGELCDGSDPEQGSCIDFGFDAGRLGCNGFCAPAFTGCGVIDWRASSSGTTQDIVGLWADDDEVYAIGAGGAIRRFDGSTWSSEHVVGQPINGIWGSGTELFAVGNGGVSHRKNDLWTETMVGPANQPHQLRAVWGTSPSNVYAVGASGVIDHFDGTTWSPITSPTTDLLISIWGSSASDIWIGGAQGTIVHYDGTTWTATLLSPGAELRGLWGSGPDDVWATAGAGTIFHYTNGTWSPVTVPPTGALLGMWGSSASNIFALAYNAILHYDGTRWRHLVSLPSSQFAYSMSGANPRAVYVGTTNGTVLRYRGALWETQVFTPAGAAWGSSLDDIYSVSSVTMHFDGSSWSAVNMPDSARRHAIWGSGPQDVFIGGERFGSPVVASMVHLDATGWQIQPLPAGVRTITNISGVGSSSVFASAYSTDSPPRGRVVRYNGTTWTLETIPDGPGLFAIWTRSPTDVFAAGDGGRILHYNGTAWTAQTTPVTSRVNQLWGTATTMFATTNDGQLLRHDGTQWIVDPTAPVIGPFTALWGAAGDDIFAAGGESLLHYDGDRWSPVRVPAGTQVASLWGLAGRVGLFGQVRLGGGATTGVTWLHRQTLWHCRAQELVCDDVIDDDCDDLIDADDPDC